MRPRPAVQGATGVRRMFPIGYATVIALQVALGRFSARPVVPSNPAGLQPSPPRSPTLDFGLWTLDVSRPQHHHARPARGPARDSSFSIHHSLSFEAGCDKKCASPYIGERFGENSVGGKWLMGAVLRIPLTLTGRGKGAVGGEIISLNCCKWLQINRTFYQVVGRSPSWPLAGAATPASWPALPGCGAKRPCRSSGLRRGCRSARPKGPSPGSLIWLR